jgi:hypothetical protein
VHQNILRGEDIGARSQYEPSIFIDFVTGGHLLPAFVAAGPPTSPHRQFTLE